MSANYNRQPDGSIMVESVVQGRPPSPAERAQLNDAVNKMVAIFNAIPSDMWPSLVGSMLATVAMTHPDPIEAGADLLDVCLLSLRNAVTRTAGHA